MAESDLKAFLDVAEELKVLGLTDTSGFKRDLGLTGREISSILIGRAPTLLRSHWSRAPEW